MLHTQKDIPLAEPTEATHIEKGNDIALVSSKIEDDGDQQQDWSPEEEKALV